MGLFNINDTNGDSLILDEFQNKLKEKFPKDWLFGAEFGVAYGGGIERICKNWFRRGAVWGFDTFEGHPKHLSDSLNSKEATMMDGWYAKYGTSMLNRDYIKANLYEQGIYNFILVKGEINPASLENVQYLHYALLDLDLIQPTKLAFDLIKNKMLIGGYICVHDVVPEEQLPEIHHWWYDEIMPNYSLKEVKLGKFLGVYEVGK